MASRDIILDIIAKVQSREVEKLAAQMDAAAKSTDGASAAAKRQQSTLEVLDREISQAKARVRELGDEFNRTGKVDVFDNLRSANKELRGLERIKGDLTKSLVAGVEDAGRDVMKGVPAFGSGVVRSISEAVSSMPPPAQAAIYGGIAGAIGAGSSLIGSAAAAAIIGGVGAGGLAIGIAEAVKDPAVATAFSGLGGQLGKALEDDAQVFAGPLIKASHIFADEFAKMEPDIAGSFGELSKEVVPLAKGLSGLAREALPGIRAAATAAGPVFDRLARDAPIIGHEIGEFLHDIAESSPGAVNGLEDLLAAGGTALRVAGGVIKELSFGLELLHNEGNLAQTVAEFQAAGYAADHGGESFSKLADIFGRDRDQADDLTQSLRRMSDELADELGKTMSVKEAADGWSRSLLNLRSSVDENGRSLDATTEKGLNNRDAILASAQAAERQREATIAAAGGQNASKEAIEAANAKYGAQIDQLRQLALNLGFSKAAVDDLIKGLDAIPVVKRTEIQIRATGDVETFRSVQHLANGAFTAHTVKARAGGGPVSAGVPYLVGEKGPELFTPGQSGTIVPNGALTGGGRGQPAAMTLNITTGGGFGDQLLAQWLHHAVRTGQVQLSAGGKTVRVGITS